MRESERAVNGFKLEFLFSVSQLDRPQKQYVCVAHTCASASYEID